MSSEFVFFLLKVFNKRPPTDSHLSRRAHRSWRHRHETRWHRTQVLETP